MRERPEELFKDFGIGVVEFGKCGWEILNIWEINHFFLSMIKD